MTIRDLANWLLDRSVFWLVPYCLLQAVFGIFGLWLKS